METKELELKHLAAYLPYELQVENLNCRIDYTNIKYSELTNLYCVITKTHKKLWHYKTNAGNNATIEKCKPILRPLSDLINVPDMYLILSFESIEEFEEKETLTFDKLFYWEVENLCKNHFDVFGLIDAGLAININTLNYGNSIV